jgi:hypothetical protein
MHSLKSIPGDANLGGLSLRVFQVLSKYTEFPWAILQVQCKRKGVDPAALEVEDLRTVIENLATGVQRFSSPAKGELVRSELSALLRDYRQESEPPVATRIEERQVPPAAPANQGGEAVPCPACRAQVAPGRFCSNCGAALVAARRCPGCGAPAQGKFCAECGAALGAG